MHGDDVWKCREPWNELARRIGVRVTDRHVQRREVRGTECLAGGGFQYSVPKLFLIVAVPGREHPHLVPVDVDRGDIDPVRGRAGHHPDRDHGRIVAPQGRASVS
jgi:hypothetical protein